MCVLCVCDETHTHTDKRAREKRVAGQPTQGKRGCKVAQSIARALAARRNKAHSSHHHIARIEGELELALLNWARANDETDQTRGKKGFQCFCARAYVQRESGIYGAGLQ